MYDKNDKRRLYWLIDQYLIGNINESTFCDEYYSSYDLEIDDEVLNDNEKVIFEALNQVSARFSEHKGDHHLDSRAFATREELRQKILETKNALIW